MPDHRLPDTLHMGGRRDALQRKGRGKKPLCLRAPSPFLPLASLKYSCIGLHCCSRVREVDTSPEQAVDCQGLVCNCAGSESSLEHGGAKPLDSNQFSSFFFLFTLEGSRNMFSLVSSVQEHCRKNMRGKSEWKNGWRRKGKAITFTLPLADFLVKINS